MLRGTWSAAFAKAVRFAAASSATRRAAAAFSARFALASAYVFCWQRFWFLVWTSAGVVWCRGGARVTAGHANIYLYIHTCMRIFCITQL